MVPVSSINSPVREQMPATQLFETTLATLGKNIPHCSVQEFKEIMQAVEYASFLAIVKSYNSLDAILGLAERGQVEYLRCILYHLQPGDRIDICRLTGDEKRTMLHLASAHGKISVVKLINKLFEETRGDWLLLVALSDAAGFTALDYVAHLPSPQHEPLSRALVHGLTPTEQFCLFNTSKAFQKVASANDLMKIVEQANNSSGRNVDYDDFTAQVKEMLQTQFEEWTRQQTKANQLMLKKHAQEHAHLNDELTKCQKELRLLQPLKKEVEVLKYQLSQCEQRCEKLAPVKSAFENFDDLLPKLNKEIGKMQAAISEFQEFQLLKKVEQQKWREENLEALALDGDKPDEEAQEVDGVDPIQRALMKDIATLQKCMRQLCTRVKGLEASCVYLEKGKPETADASPGTDISFSTCTLCAPQEDSSTPSSTSSSRVSSSDSLESQDISGSLDMVSHM